MRGPRLKRTGAAAITALALALPAASQTPLAKTALDDTWISVSGTVVGTRLDSFRLDYGQGVITVEMDDFDFYAEGRNLMENDQVVVYGKVDDDLFEQRTIEASSVYVENLGTHFYANAADEEDFVSWTVTAPILVGKMELTGNVTQIDGRKFTVDTGMNRFEVNTSTLAYNPMDDTGYLRIDKGDRVKVSGNLDATLFSKRQIDANWIIELNK